VAAPSNGAEQGLGREAEQVAGGVQQPFFLFSKMSITVGSKSGGDNPTYHRHQLKSNGDENRR